MENQNKKWSKKLAYSFIFFITAWLCFVFSPGKIIWDFIELFPIAFQLLVWKMFPLLVNLAFIKIFGFYFWIFLSFYVGLQVFNETKKIAGPVSANIPRGLALLLVIISLFSFLFVSTSTIVLYFDLLEGTVYSF